ncbi:MAG TPA: cation diffusion facilitator family transporter [Rhodothermales bacterium]
MQQSALKDPRRVAMLASLGVSFFMLAAKTTAYTITGSAAIFSDAAESVAHVLATAFVAYSLWYAIQPADEKHPYGHGKMAYISTGFEGGLVLLAAITILYSSTRSLIEGPELDNLGIGLIFIGAAGAVNLALGMYLVWTGRRHNSLVLVSNGRHVLTDMWTSAGVILGVSLVMITGLTWLDPIVAMAFGLYIGYTAVDMLRDAAGGLLESASPEDTARIVATLEESVEDGTIKGFHQLRHRRVQDRVWIEYHLHFPSSVSLVDAHARSHQVEDRVVSLFPGDEVLVTAHLEPAAHREAHPSGFAEPDDPLGAGAIPGRRR